VSATPQDPALYFAWLRALTDWDCFARAWGAIGFAYALGCASNGRPAQPRVTL
jgi:hypothetical protein